MKTNKNNPQQSPGGKSNGQRQNGNNSITPVTPVTRGGKKDPSTPPPGLRFPERSIEHQHQEEEKGNDKKQQGK